MDVVLDIGNTNVKVGFFSGGQLEKTLSFPSQPLTGIYRQLGGITFSRAIISSVIDIPSHILHYLRGKGKELIVLDHQAALPIKLAYDTPETLGRDRIALAVGAAGLLPSQDVLIISAGSCITYNLLTADGQFQGGAISPGLHMRLRAMHEFTGALPLAELAADQQPALVAKSTHASLLSGAVNGAIFEIEGFAARLTEKYPGLSVLLSGGDSRYLHSKLNIPVRTEAELALYGLHKILQLNAKKSA